MFSATDCRKSLNVWAGLRYIHSAMTRASVQVTVWMQSRMCPCCGHEDPRMVSGSRTPIFECPECGQDLYARPPLSYAEMEGFEALEGSAGRRIEGTGAWWLAPGSGADAAQAVLSRSGRRQRGWWRAGWGLGRIKFGRTGIGRWMIRTIRRAWARLTTRRYC